MLKDVRHALRSLAQAKGWTTVVILSLALGIGANTTLFSAVDAQLLTKVPVRDPDSLVRLRSVGRNDMATSTSDYGRSNPIDGQNVRSTFSYPMYHQLVAANKTMSGVVACAPFGQVNLFADGVAELESAFVSSGNYYQLLGVSARLGRVIVPDDDRPTAPPVALISSRLWHARFGTEPSVIGKTVRLNSVLVTIVGVLPPDFTGIQTPASRLPDVSMPLSVVPQIQTANGPSLLEQATNWWLELVGRLKPGSTAAQVQGNLEAVFQNTARAGLGAYLNGLSDEARNTSRNRDRTEVPRVVVNSAARGVYDASPRDVRSMTILSIVVALVLLIVCANVANLLLSRAAGRQREMSVRLSLGATRARLVRQLLTESLLLASLGGALGVLVGYWARPLMPGSDHVSALDWRLLLFVVLLTGLTGLIFGIAPALRGTDLELNAALKESARGVMGRRSVLAKGLLVAQVAISLVLLVGAGLFMRTLVNLRHVDVGFNPENLLLFHINPQLNRYDDKQMPILYRNLLDRLAAVPGVRGAAVSAPALLIGWINSTSIFVQGRTYASDPHQQRGNDINRVIISPNFFEVMQIPVEMGRAFTDHDTATAPKVVVINEAAVRKYFPNENPIGRHFGSSPETTGELEIVGILRDAKYDSVREPSPPTMYVPYPQARMGNGVFEIRTSGAPTALVVAVREAVRQVDPNLPVTDVSTQIEQVEERFAQEKLFAQAYALFGALALLLASIGLFGLMSYSVSRRTNEIGIRMALGARREDVLRLVMRESMALVAVGVVAGVGISSIGARFVAALLFDVPPRDVTTMGVAIGVMAVVSAFASYLPARRASRVDPMVALRYE